MSERRSPTPSSIRVVGAFVSGEAAQCLLHAPISL